MVSRVKSDNEMTFSRHFATIYFELWLHYSIDICFTIKPESNRVIFSILNPKQNRTSNMFLTIFIIGTFSLVFAQPSLGVS